MRKEKRIYRNFQPLDTSFSLFAEGGTTIQKYDAGADHYEPNHRLTPLVIHPRIYVTDPDHILSDGNKNAELINVEWFQLVDGVRTKITNDANYSIRDENSNYKGSLTVKKNIPFGSNITLEFVGEFFDSRTKQTLHYTDTILLSTIAYAPARVTLKLDCGTLIRYNPLEDSDTVKVKAQLYVGETLVGSGNSKFWWYVVENNIERLVDTNEDLFYVSGIGTNTLIVDKRFVNKQLTLRCKGDYVYNNEPAPAKPTPLAQECDLKIVVTYPYWEVDDIHITGGIEVNAGLDKTQATCVISTGKGTVENPAQFFDIKFLQRKVQAGAEFKEVGCGEKTLIDCRVIEQSTGMASDIAVDVEEKGCLKALSSGGAILCHNGAVIVTR